MQRPKSDMPTPWGAGSKGERLRQLEALCREFRIETLLPSVAACGEVLRDRDNVDVAVVGRFKAGKSSLLNSLIGREILPVAAVPLTAAVTRLRYGSRDRALVRYLDGHEAEVPPGELAEYVTEQRNPANTKGVALVEVETPGLQPYQGIRIVDTPGLGSVFAHNTRASMDWLPRVGAAFLAVSADQPLSEYDVDLLTELAKHTPEVSILLTKADLLAPHDLAEVTRFIGDQLGSLTKADVRIFPFSIRPGHEGQREDFQRYLLREVAERHEERSQEIIRYKLRVLAKGCRQYLRMALSAASAAAAARELLERQLTEERERLSTVQNEIFVLTMELKRRVQAEALQRFLKHSAGLTVRFRASLREAMPQWRGHLRRMTEQFAGWMGDILSAELGPLSHQEGDELTARHLAAAQESLARAVRAFQDRLASEIEQALDMSFAGATFEGTIRHPERPDIRVSRVFDIPFEILWFVIPMAIFRPLVNRHFVRRISWEAEKNLHRLAGQWSQAIGESIDGLARHAQQFMREELATIEGLVSQAHDQRPAIEKALAALNELETPR